MHRQQCDQPRQCRFGPFVQVRSVRVQPVPAASGAEVVQDRLRLVVSQKPTQESPRPLPPHGILRAPVGFRTGFHQGHRFDGLLIEPRPFARALQPPLVADQADRPVVGKLQADQPFQRTQALFDHAGVRQPLAAQDQDVRQLGVGVGDHVFTPRPVFRGVALELVIKPDRQRGACAPRERIAAETPQVRMNADQRKGPGPRRLQTFGGFQRSAKQSGGKRQRRFVRSQGHAHPQGPQRPAVHVFAAHFFQPAPVEAHEVAEASRPRLEGIMQKRQVCADRFQH